MQTKPVKVGDTYIGPGYPVYVIAEIGINHNGSLEIAKKLIDGAVFAGCNAVKFQKRTPEISTPEDQKNVERDTPWGRMTYLEYRKRIEFGFQEYAEIDRYCREKGIHWFASPWDEESLDFILSFDPVMIKIASSSLTDIGMIQKARESGKPIMLSTGMSDMEMVDTVVKMIGTDNLLLAQSTSTYPCPVDELNLNVIQTYRQKFPGVVVGYSGHETGLAPTLAAVALGAHFVERHITLDRAMWGSDQAASVEIGGMFRLVKDIRDIEKALGDGIKKIYPSEHKSMLRLRRFQTLPQPALDE